MLQLRLSAATCGRAAAAVVPGGGPSQLLLPVRHKSLAKERAQKEREAQRAKQAEQKKTRLAAIQADQSFTSQAITLLERPPMARNLPPLTRKVSSWVFLDVWASLRGSPWAWVYVHFPFPNSNSIHLNSV